MRKELEALVEKRKELEENKLDPVYKTELACLEARLLKDIAQLSLSFVNGDKDNRSFLWGKKIPTDATLLKDIIHLLEESVIKSKGKTERKCKECVIIGCSMLGDVARARNSTEKAKNWYRKAIVEAHEGDFNDLKRESNKKLKEILRAQKKERNKKSEEKNNK